MQASPFAIQVKDFREPVQRVLRLDPWLLLASIGLLTCGAFVIHGATSTDIPGQPYHYVYRQIAYGVVGLVLMLLLSRFDYSRTRGWKAGLYVFMIGSIFAVFALGGVTRGSKRWINLPFFNFQPSELGKVLLTLAVAGFIVDRVRRLQDLDTTARVMLLALLPSVMVVT
jgi:rod shape determining protein RodA